MNQDEYFDALGIDTTSNNEQEMKKLREAYDKAHDIRKFEIEMYWRRTSYLWTIQAAALGGLALILSNLTSFSSNCEIPPASDILLTDCIFQYLQLLAVIAIWLFGLFSAYIWLFLLEGAKFWQNNWERHVDFLEDYFSGALYKTYSVDSNIVSPPYSVSSLNKAMAWFVIVLWNFIGLMGGLIFSNVSNAYYVTFVLVIAILFLVACYFNANLRMSEFGEPYSARSPARFKIKKLRKRPSPRSSTNFDEN